MLKLTNFPQIPKISIFLNFALNKLTLKMSCLASAIACIDWTPWGDQMMFLDILKSTVMMRNMLPPYDPSKLPSVPCDHLAYCSPPL